MTRGIRRSAIRTLGREVLAALLAQGWEVEVSGSCHLRLRSPSGATVIASLSGSDSFHGRKRIVGELRRKGLVFEGKAA